MEMRHPEPTPATESQVTLTPLQNLQCKNFAFELAGHGLGVGRVCHKFSGVFRYEIWLARLWGQDLGFHLQVSSAHKVREAHLGVRRLGCVLAGSCVAGLPNLGLTQPMCLETLTALIHALMAPAGNEYTW